MIHLEGRVTAVNVNTATLAIRSNDEDQNSLLTFSLLTNADEWHLSQILEITASAGVLSAKIGVEFSREEREFYNSAPFHTAPHKITVSITVTDSFMNKPILLGFSIFSLFPVTIPIFTGILFYRHTRTLEVQSAISENDSSESPSSVSSSPPSSPSPLESSRESGTHSSPLRSCAQGSDENSYRPVSLASGNHNQCFLL